MATIESSAGTSAQGLILPSVSGFVAFFSIMLPLLYRAFRNYRESQADAAFGRKHGCEEPLEIPNRWPLGIDRLKELWEWNAKSRLLFFFCSTAKEYEPRNNLSQYLLFGPRAFFVMDSKNIESILSTDFKSYGFGARAGVFAPLLGNGIFTQEGQAWKHSRELLRKQFARLQHQNVDHFRDYVDNLITCIPAEGDIDLQSLFFKLTLDVSTALLFGRSVNSLLANCDQAKENKKFDKSFDLAQEGLAKRFRLAPFHFLYNPSSFRQACREVHSFVDEYIKERTKKENVEVLRDSPSWFVDQITKESESQADVRDQLINVLLAGRDTTACCLSWTFRLLVRHTKVMNRLRQEVTSVMEGSSTPTRDQIRQMPYLDCVIKESLRLYPPVPINSREAIRTTILPTGGGPDGNYPILVRKGELVVFNHYLNSRKKLFYGSDAEDFRPERWETGELENIGWGYFPFIGGPRRCLGESFALTEICYVVVRLLQTFPVFSLPLGDEQEPIGTERQRLTLVLSSADGCRVTVSRGRGV